MAKSGKATNTGKPKALKRPDTSFNFGANAKRPGGKSRNSAYFRSKYAGGGS